MSGQTHYTENKCHKKQFKDKIEALFALAKCRFRAKKGANRSECRVYLCPICGKYHLTSKKYKKKYDR